MKQSGRRSTGPTGRSGATQRRSAGAARRALSATRRPSRPRTARPVTDRPSTAPTASTGSIRRTTRSVAPRAGQRRRATALVLSPLARQIAALGLALCAVALSLAYPLRNYLEQQAAERAAVAEQHQLQEQIADLQAQQAALRDPAYIKEEAKQRLQYVSPGDTVYVVKVPATATTSDAPAGATGAASDASGDGAAGATGDDGSAAGDAAAGRASGDGAAGATGDDGSAAGDAAASGSSGGESDGESWYASLWDTLSGGDPVGPAH